MSDGAAGEQDLPWAHLPFKWLANAGMGGKYGAGVLVEVPPGESYPAYLHDKSERLVYIYSGVGEHTGSGGPAAVETDDVLIVPPGDWHGFRNTGDGVARIWIAWTPATDFPFDDYRVAGEGEERRPTGGIIRRKLRAAPMDPSTTPKEKGFEKLGIIWGGAEGARAITLGWALFEPGGTHHMHRHLRGDEILHVVRGDGMHVTKAGERPLVGEGFDYAPAGEWHSMVVKAGQLEGIFVYLGAASLEEAGYEVDPEPAA